MLRRVTAIEFARDVTQGRTKPALLVCEADDKSTVEVVAKFSRGCDQGVTSLAFEVLGACLAADLGLPVSEPFLVEISPEWSNTLTYAARKTQVQASSPLAFGSKLVTSYAAWNAGSHLTAAMVPMGAAIFAFDAIVQNVDRRAGNPNCLVQGEKFRIFDHELCFDASIMIGWKPPWVLGGLNSLETPGAHIFREELRKKVTPDILSDIRAAWLKITDERLAQYVAAIPVEWIAAADKIATAVKLIKDARDHIVDCLKEIERVLQ